MGRRHVFSALCAIWLVRALRRPRRIRSTHPQEPAPKTTAAPADPGRHQRGRAGFLWRHLDASDRWHHGLTSLGLLVAVAGFVFVAMQIRDARRTTGAAAWATMSGQLLDFDKALVDEPTAADYFGGGDRSKKASDRSKAWNLAVMQLDLWDAWNGQEPYVKQLDLAAIDDWKTSLYGRSPLLCRVLAKTPGYPEWFRHDGYVRCGSLWPSDVPAPPAPG
jgi:hypothetical protein